jgi:hypothetical protein
MWDVTNPLQRKRDRYRHQRAALDGDRPSRRKYQHRGPDTVESAGHDEPELPIPAHPVSRRRSLHLQHSQFYNAASSLSNQVNGQQLEGTLYQIEGIDDDQRTGMLQILIPPVQAIETVDVSTSNYEAELGRATAAVVNVIIKSGTNHFHGLLTEYVQNSDADARAYFNTTVGHVAYNYFGGALAAPS